jgi:hypothetical protein
MRFEPRIFFSLILCMASLAQQALCADALDPSVLPTNNLAPILTAIAALLTALFGGIATLLSAIFASKAKNRSEEAKELAQEIENKMYMQITRDPDFLNTLERQGHFLRSTNVTHLEQCMGKLLADSDFLIGQIRNHHHIVNLIDQKISVLNDQVTKQLNSINEAQITLEGKFFDISLDTKLALDKIGGVGPPPSDRVEKSFSPLRKKDGHKPSEV